MPSFEMVLFEIDVVIHFAFYHEQMKIKSNTVITYRGTRIIYVPSKKTTLE